MSAWGKGGLTLAQKLRATAPPVIETPVVLVRAPFTPIQPPDLCPHDWYHHHTNDGSIHPPPISSLSSTHTLAISLLLIQNDTMLMIREWDDEEKQDEKQDEKSSIIVWKIPGGHLQSQETIPQALTRILSSHLPSSMVSSFIPTHYITLEHYPSLKQQWMRVAVTGTMSQPQLTSDQNTFTWLPLTGIDSHLSYNDTQQLDAYRSGRSIPMTYTTASIPYFSYYLLELVMIHKHKILLVQYEHDNTKWWSLPQTHVDRGEHLTFTSIRIARALFGICLESVDGILAITTQSRTDISCEGARFTTVVDIDKQPMKGKDGETTTTVNTKQHVIDEAVKKAAANATLSETTSLSNGVSSLSLTSSTPVDIPNTSSTNTPSEPSSDTSTNTTATRELPIDPSFNASTSPFHTWFTLEELHELDRQEELRHDLLTMLTPVLQNQSMGIPLIHV